MSCHHPLNELIRAAKNAELLLGHKKRLHIFVESCTTPSSNEEGNNNTPSSNNVEIVYSPTLAFTSCEARRAAQHLLNALVLFTSQPTPRAAKPPSHNDDAPPADTSSPSPVMPQWFPGTPRAIPPRTRPTTLRIHPSYTAIFAPFAKDALSILYHDFFNGLYKSFKNSPSAHKLVQCKQWSGTFSYAHFTPPWLEVQCNMNDRVFCTNLSTAVILPKPHDLRNSLAVVRMQAVLAAFYEREHGCRPLLDTLISKHMRNETHRSQSIPVATNVHHDVQRTHASTQTHPHHQSHPHVEQQQARNSPPPPAQPPPENQRE